MSGQQQEKTRERTPANLGIKFNPALGAANLKRFYATVRALLKSNAEQQAAKVSNGIEPELDWNSTGFVKRTTYVCNTYSGVAHA